MEVKDFVASIVEETSDDLKQFGVLGMKWGVRKNRKGMVKARSTMTRRSRKDAEWLNDKLLRGGNYAKTYNKTYRRAQFQIRKSIRLINKNEKYRRQDFRKDSPLRREYYSDISKALTSALNSSAAKHGASPSRGLELHFNADVSKEVQPTVTIRQRDNRPGRRDTRKNQKVSIKQLKHSADPSEVVVEVEYDAMGYVLGLKFPEDTEKNDMEHSADTSDFIAAIVEEAPDDVKMYGVLGMKWGVRKDRRTKNSQSSESSDDSKSSKSSSSSDSKSKTSRSSSNSRSPFSDISDEELKNRIMRIENEQKLSRLLAPPAKKPNAAKVFIGGVLQNAGRQVLTTALATAGTYAVSAAARKYGSEGLAEAFGKKKKKAIQIGGK